MLLLLPSLCAAAGENAADIGTVQPYVWVRPGFTWIADDPSNPTAQDGFIADARVGFDGQLAQLPISGRAELALLPEPVVTDASVTVTPVPWLFVRLGQMKVPFSINRIAVDTRRQFTTTPTFLAEASITREIGADVTVRVPIAKADRIVLSSGIYNGEGPNRIQNVNQRFQLVQRVLVTPFGARSGAFEGTNRRPYLGVGGGWMYDYAGEELGAQEVNTFGAELQFAWDIFSLQGEVLDQAIVHANTTVADYHVQGFYAQVGCFVPAPWARDHLEVVGRFDMSDPNTAFGAAEGEAQPDLQATRRISAGLNYYVRKDPSRFHDLKVQASFEHVDPLEGEDADDDSFTLTALARF